VDACRHGRAQGIRKPLAASKEAPVPRPCRPEARICPTTAILNNCRDGHEEAGEPKVTPSSMLGQDRKSRERKTPVRSCNYLYTNGNPDLDPTSKCMPVPGMIALMPKRKRIHIANQMASEEISFWHFSTCWQCTIILRDPSASPHLWAQSASGASRPNLPAKGSR